MIKALTTFVTGLICFQAVLAQTNPPESIDAEQAEILALAKKLAHASLAYKMAASQQMLEEVNYFSEHLKLPIPHPLSLQDVKIIRVTPLWFSKVDSSDTNLSRADRVRTASLFTGGVVQTSNFYFSVVKGRLWSIQRMKIKNENSLFDLYPELFKATSLVDTNGAYELATQWLASVSIDVKSLERKFKPSLSQWHFNGKPEDLPKGDSMPEPSKSTNVTMLPIYEVQWGQGQGYAVKVTIIGTTKELFTLDVMDTSFSKRPLLVITNAVELNERPEPPMKHLQRPIPESSQTNSAPANPTTPNPSPFRQNINVK